MRAPIYRNLDQPFRIGGFSPMELVFLCVTFAGGGELGQSLAIGRGWSFAVTFLMALSLFAFRRAFGELFLLRLVRFLGLPSQLRPAIFKRSSL